MTDNSDTKLPSTQEQQPVVVPSPTTHLSSFLAGISGGSASTILLYPLDLVKVRMQVDERKRGSSSPTTLTTTSTRLDRPRTICTTLKGVIRHEGYLGLYRGLTPAIIGSAASWGGFFILYEEMKRQMLKRKQDIHGYNASSQYFTVAENQQQQVAVKLGPTEHFSASCLAGACLVALTNPLWLIKTRLQLQNSQLQHQIMSSQAGVSTKATALTKSAPQPIGSMQHKVKPAYRGIRHAATTIIQEEGILALYKGSIPALMLVSHGGIQFVTYEFLKEHFFANFANKSNINEQQQQQQFKKSSGKRNGTIRERLRDSLGFLVMGAASKFVASTATYPLQVIKSRLQQRSQVIEMSETTGEIIVTKRDYSGVVDCIKKIVKNEGMNGFFKGCVTNAMRVAPSAAITFVTYEFVLDMLTHEG